jgi:nicotinate-nucleotide adenylyltransferase
MHILVYGGTFDPIHNGHLITSRAAREALGADQVLFVPVWVSPFKKGDPPAAAPAQRLEMIRLAIEGESGFAVDECEYRRGAQGRPSYTMDTLEELRRERPQDRFTLLLGQDQLAKLHAWHRVGEILAAADVALMGRPAGAAQAAAEGGLRAMEAKLGAEVAERLRAAMLATPLIEISATQVRGRVRDGLSISGLVPDAVGAYIARHNLYR